MRTRSSVPFETRAQMILAYLSSNNSITVEKVAELCNVSFSTVRTQLSEMHDKNLLVRTHGGAIRLDPDAKQVEAISNLSAKERIAALAVEQIVPGDIVAIGGGTTGLCLARALRSSRDIVVVTNSIRNAQELAENHSIELQICGGVIRSKPGVCSGTRAEDFFKNLTATKSFIGTDSVQPQNGFTVMNPDERVERAISFCAKTRYVLFDHSKFTKGPYIDSLARFEDISVCITDSGASDADVMMLKDHGVSVLLA